MLRLPPATLPGVIRFACIVVLNGAGLHPRRDSPPDSLLRRESAPPSPRLSAYHLISADVHLERGHGQSAHRRQRPQSRKESLVGPVDSPLVVVTQGQGDRADKLGGR